MPPRKTKGEAFSYVSVLDALSRGLYPNKLHVVREFVQNAFDSLYDLRRLHPRQSLHPVHIKIQKPSIFIADNGMGMPRNRIRQYRYLGFTEKERASHAGFRGIGKYSALGVAEKIIVDTSPYNSSSRFQAIIHADRMLEEATRNKKMPLDDVLRKHTELSESRAKKSEHYTFVELHGIRKDSEILLSENRLIEYLGRTAPVPLDPKFTFTRRIVRKLRTEVPDYMAIDIMVNDQNIFKPYFTNCRDPEFERIFYDDEETRLLAFCWYCENLEKGQFDPKDDAGLVYRVKNIAVGEEQLTRRTIWYSTPNRATYFFGEIHVLDTEVIPSSDRTDFEDNSARKHLYKRCRRISQVLNQQAGRESAIRRFHEELDKGLEIVSDTEKRATAGDIPIELREVELLNLQLLQNNIQKRMKGPRDPKAQTRARRLIKRTRTLLSNLRGEEKHFFDLRRELKFDKKLQALYETIIKILREEFESNPRTLDRIIRRIRKELG